MIRFRGIILALLFPLLMLSAGPGPAGAVTPSQPPSPTGQAVAATATAGPPQRTHAAVLSSPPEMTAAQLTQVQQAVDRSGGHGPPLAASAAAAAPAVPETGAATSGGAAPLAPGTFSFFRNVDLGAGAPTSQTSSTDEPSVANVGNVVFYTGNWFAARSADGGQTFSYVNPFTAFPSVNNGFCCDQSTIYDSSRNIMIWSLLYIPDNSSGSIRIAVANGGAGVLNSNWCYYTFNPQNLGLPTQRWFDYPHIALGADNLYVTANVFRTTNNSWTNTTILRLPLDTLAACGSLTYQHFTVSDQFNFTATDGATTTMYWASNTNTSSMRIYNWPESTTTISWDDRTIPAYMAAATYLCAGPDGLNACGRSDPRVMGAWDAGGVLGFMWNASQGGSFPYPYVYVARFRESDRLLLDEPII
ncbi:MAG TPA: hypothetical protein VLS25_12800, partial [Dehalococcoidia bacterium]|nr:hypothetical protein [Dehalococcoidia bacterium]